MKDVTEYETTDVITFSGAGTKKAPELAIEWVPRGQGSGPNYTLLPLKAAGSTSVSLNVASGDVLASATDLNIASKGTPFVVGRFFNSLVPEEFGYGDGWTDVNTPHLTMASDGSALFTDKSGANYVFVKESADGGFSTPRGLDAKLCLKSAGECGVLNWPAKATYAVWNLGTEEEIYYAGKSGTLYPDVIERLGKEAEAAHYAKKAVLPTSWTDSDSATIEYAESATLGYTGAAFPAEGESRSILDHRRQLGSSQAHRIRRRARRTSHL
jgi:hypothetical protein